MKENLKKSTPLRCKLGLHKWGAEKEVVSYVDMFITGYPVGQTIALPTLSKQCVYCDLIESRLNKKV